MGLGGRFLPGAAFLIAYRAEVRRLWALVWAKVNKDSLNQSMATGSTPPREKQEPPETIPSTPMRGRGRRVRPDLSDPDKRAGLLSITDEPVEAVKAAEVAGIEFFFESVSSNGKSVQAYVLLTPEGTVAILSG